MCLLTLRPSTPHGSDYYLHLPHWDANHPTLMLYMDDRFNNFIQLGRVWFQPVPGRAEDHFVCCAEDEDNDFLLQHCTRVDANGVLVAGATIHQIRRPGAWNVEGQKLWPPPLIFDLHREVWVDTSDGWGTQRSRRTRRRTTREMQRC